jgi:hypothetical protein
MNLVETHCTDLLLLLRCTWFDCDCCYWLNMNLVENSSVGALLLLLLFRRYMLGINLVETSCTRLLLLWCRCYW